MGCVEIVRYIRGLRATPDGRRLTRAEKLVLIVLATYQNGARGEAWPTSRVLAEYADVHRSSVSRVLAGLRVARMVEVVPRFGPQGGQRSNGYRLAGLAAPPAASEAAPPAASEAAPPAASEAAPPAAPRRPIRSYGKDQREATTGKDRSLSTAAAGDGPTVVARESAAPLVTAAGAGAARPDRLWEALEAACGPPATASERAESRRACRELHEAGARPEEVAQRAQEARRRWRDGVVTPRALAKHWGELGRTAGGAVRACSSVDLMDRLHQAELEGGIAGLLRAAGLESWAVEPPRPRLADPRQPGRPAPGAAPPPVLPAAVGPLRGPGPGRAVWTPVALPGA